MPKKVWSAGEALLAADLNNNFSLGWEKLADVTLASDAETLLSGSFGAYNLLRISIYCAGTASSTTLRLQCNGDTGANYDYRYIHDSDAPSTSLAQTSIALTSNFSGVRIFNLDIFNLAAIAKRIQSNGIAVYEMYHGSNVWNNTTDQITSITLLTGAGNLLAGTRMIVEGFNG